MLHIIDFIDAAIFLTPVLAAAVGLGWCVVGLLRPQSVRW
jgi:nitroreductase